MRHGLGQSLAMVKQMISAANERTLDDALMLPPHERACLVRSMICKKDLRGF